MADISKQKDELRKERRKRNAANKLKKTIFYTIILIVFFAIIFLWFISENYDLKSRARCRSASQISGKGFPITLEDANVKQLLPVEDDIAVVTKTAVYIYNQNGARLYTDVNKYINPMIKTAGYNILTYDYGASNFKISNNLGIVYEGSVDSRIYDCDITSNGYYAVAQMPLGALSQVTVYDNSNNNIYDWKTSLGYITDVSFNKKGDLLSAVTINSDDAYLFSSLSIHNIKKDIAPIYIKLDREIVLSTVWTKQNKLQVITDKSIRIYDSNGETLFIVDTPKNMSRYLNSENGGVYISCYNKYTSQSTIYSFDKLLRNIGETTIDEKVEELITDTDRLMIVTDTSVYLSNPKLSELNKRDYGAVSKIEMVGNKYYSVKSNELFHGVL